MTIGSIVFIKKRVFQVWRWLKSKFENVNWLVCRIATIGTRIATMARRKPGTHRARSRVKRKRPEIKHKNGTGGGQSKIVQSQSKAQAPATKKKSSEAIQDRFSPEAAKPKRLRSSDVPVNVGPKVSMPRPNAIIMKIFGVMSSYKFEREMIEYGKKNLKGYLQRRWKQDKIIPHLVTRYMFC